MTARRDFLRGLAAAGAAAATVPDLALAEPLAGLGPAVGAADADQALAALYARYIALVAAAEAASNRAWDISQAVQYPEPPAAIFVQPGDHDLGLSRFADQPIRHGLGRYSACAALQHFANVAGLYGRHGRMDAICARSTEILDALNAHEEAWRQAQIDAGQTHADQEALEAWATARDQAGALASAQATTLRGVMMKATAIATTERDIEGLNDWRADVVDNGEDPSTRLATSLTLDLIRIAGLPIGSATTVV